MKNFFMVTMTLLLVSVTHAGLAPDFLPTSSYYNGRHDRSFDLGLEGVLDIQLQFAVYRNEELYDDEGVNEAQLMMEYTGYTGDLLGSENAFVYGYQIFCEDTSTAELTYFALTGINPNAIDSVEQDIHEQDDIDSGAWESLGVQPKGDGGYYNDSKTKAIWEFDGGAMIQGEQSWFLFLYSGYDWIKGDIEVQPLADDDIPIPGDNDIPEPATLALLIGGAVLSLRRRK